MVTIAVIMIVMMMLVIVIVAITMVVVMMMMTVVRVLVSATPAAEHQPSANPGYQQSACQQQLDGKILSGANWRDAYKVMNPNTKTLNVWVGVTTPPR